MQKKNRDLISLITGKMEYEKDLVILKSTFKALRAGIDRKAEDNRKINRLGKILGKFHSYQSFKKY